MQFDSSEASYGNFSRKAVQGPIFEKPPTQIQPIELSYAAPRTVELHRTARHWQKKFQGTGRVIAMTAPHARDSTNGCSPRPTAKIPSATVPASSAMTAASDAPVISVPGTTDQPH
jgi:hypothetical protein